MSTEVRIGVAAGFLIVVVAGVYFFYGSDRGADDLRIVAGSGETVAPTIPPSRDAVAANQRPAGTRAAPSDSRTARATPQAKPNSVAGSQRTPPTANSTLASNSARPTVGDSRGPSVGSDHRRDVVAGPPVNSPIARNATPGAASGSTAANDAPLRPDASPTLLRTSPSPSLVEATRRNLESGDDAKPADHLKDSTAQPSAGHVIQRPAGFEASREPASSANDPVAASTDSIGTPARTETADKPREAGAIQLPPSLQPAGLKPVEMKPTPLSRSSDATPAVQPNVQPSATTARSAATPAGWPKSHTIESGDTLSSISTTYYDSTRHVDLLMKANPALDPRRLKIGDVITIPSPEPAATTPTISRETVRLVDASSRNVDTAPRSTAATPARSGRTYVVRKDDTLFSIARRMLGDGAKWKTILDLNRDQLKNDPHRLKIGMELAIP